MVAISLYKGNLHKVSNVPRTWIMPQRKISVKDFKTLLRRRNRALSRHLSATGTSVSAADPAVTVSDNPNPNSDAGNRDVTVVELDVVVEEETEEKAPPDKADLDEEMIEGSGEKRRLTGDDGLEKLEAEVADSAANEINHEVDDHNTVVENDATDVMEAQQVKMNEKREDEVPMNPSIEIQVLDILSPILL